VLNFVDCEPMSLNAPVSSDSSDEEHKEECCKEECEGYCDDNELPQQTLKRKREWGKDSESFL
jgi:hypothetical protein